MEITTSDRHPGSLKITEEVFNSTVHGLGALAGISGLVYGLFQLQGSLDSKIGFVVYGVSLILLMTMSSLYHALIFSKAKKVFQILDHSAILILIAGSYTPFVLYLFNGWMQFAMLVLVWSIAITGIVMKAALPSIAKRIGVGLYIGFGWLAILFIPQFSQLAGSVITLLIVGGLLYTIGAGIMAFKKPFTHVGWHLMVVLAAVAHYFAIIQLP